MSQNTNNGETNSSDIQNAFETFPKMIDKVASSGGKTRNLKKRKNKNKTKYHH